MHVFCRYSGIQFHTVSHSGDPQFPELQNLEAIHPLFYASQQTLLHLVSPWLEGRLDKFEKKLLFLALLNSTGMVQFSCIARPSDRIIETNMEPLIKMVNWHSSITRDQFSLPKYAITPDTCHLTEIYHWISEWNSIKEEAKTNYRARNLRAKLEEKELTLHRLIQSHTRSIESYAGRLADWAITAVSPPNPSQNEKDQFARWTELFKLKGLAIYQADRLDLQDLYEYMEANLDSYNGQTYTQVVLSHLRKLLVINAKGIEYGLGMPDEMELADFDLASVAGKKNFRFLEDDEDTNTVGSANRSTGRAEVSEETDIEIYNRKVVAESAPLKMPAQHQYSSKIDYLRAVAAWNIARKELERDKLAITVAVASINGMPNGEEL